MTTRDYLTQLRVIDLEISMNRSEELSWLELATKINGGLSEIKVEGSSSPDRMESLVVKAADCALNAKRERERLVYLKTTIERQIKEIEDSEMRFMLWGYYHDKETVHSLSKKIPTSDRNGRRIIEKATKAFEEKWGHTYM